MPRVRRGARWAGDRRGRGECVEDLASPLGSGGSYDEEKFGSLLASFSAPHVGVCEGADGRTSLCRRSTIRQWLPASGRAHMSLNLSEQWRLFRGAPCPAERARATGSAPAVATLAVPMRTAVPLVLVLAHAATAVGFCTAPPALAAGRAGRAHACAARAALEDRPEEVAKIRSAARGVLGQLLQDVVSAGNGGGGGGGRAAGGRIGPEEMKSAASDEEAPSEAVPRAVLGFLGTGAITRAVVTGLCRHSCADLKIVLRCGVSRHARVRARPTQQPLPLCARRAGWRL